LKIARWLGFGMGLALLGVTSAAAAQERYDWMPEMQESRIGIELDWLHTRTFGDATPALNIVTWDLTAQIGVTPRLFLDFDIPWAFVSIPTLLRANVERGVFGNPVIGLHYDKDISQTLSYYIGGGLAIPVNADPADPGFAASILPVRAEFGSYRFAPRLFPAFFKAGLEVVAPPFFGRFDIAPIVSIGLNHNTPGQIVIDQGNDLGLRARGGFLGGLRLQANFVLSDAADHVQLALEPFIGYEANGPGLFVRFGVLIALDERDGFGLNTGKVATARFAIGGKW
jgi:hypothetical protein